MTQVNVTGTLPAQAKNAGSADGKGKSSEADFSASMTAVVTINVSEDEKKKQDDAAEESTAVVTISVSSDDEQSSRISW